MARKPGLGRGLDALFADAAPIYEEEYNAEQENLSDADGSDPGYEDQAAGDRGSAGGKSSAGKSGRDRSHAANTAEETGSSKRAGSTAGRNRGSVNAAAGSADSADNNADGKSGRKRTGVNAADATTDQADRIIYIDINDIKPNSAQPRKNFDEEKLRELANSISSNGVIQPLIVRESTNGYELVAGERRWRASRIAGLAKVPCIIRDFDDRQNAIVAIIENMQREDLNPIEEALGLRSMTEKYGFTQEQVSASLGRSRTYIANSIRLLKLPEEIQEYVSSGQMSAAHGRTIINIPDKKRQREVAEKIIRNDLSVRATEKLAEKVKDELRPERKRRKKAAESTEPKAKSADVIAAERELMTLLGTKVTITGDSKGRIELEYYSIDELNRLIDLLRDAVR